MRAFSLIELMVVVSIISILVGLVVPAVNNYIIRAKVAAVLNAYTADYKNYAKERIATGADVCFQTPTCGGNSVWTGVIPTGLNPFGANHEIRSIAANSHASTFSELQIIFSGVIAPELDGRVIELIGSIDSNTGEISFQCASGFNAGINQNFPCRYLPPMCTNNNPHNAANRLHNCNSSI